MPLKNTVEAYGSVAKFLHWITALLFLVSYCSVYFRQWFTELGSDLNWTALQIHLSCGVSLGVIVFLRIYWRIINRNPDPEPGGYWEHRAAAIGHYSLYAVMILLPVTGYMGTGVQTEFFAMFDIPRFADTRIFQVLIEQNLGMTFEAFEPPVDFIHKEILGAWVAWILISGHVAAAMYHHLVKKDNTVYKMTSSSS
ncbi:cytochrome b [Haliea sp.]